MPTFEGTSNRGNLQEALDEAIKKALSSTSAADRMVTYVVTKISGRKGGFAGFNEVTVMIDAKIP